MNSKVPWIPLLLLVLGILTVAEGSVVVNVFPGVMSVTLSVSSATPNLLTAVISVNGDHAANFGVAPTSGVMAGPIVSCYVPSGNANGAVCTDVDGNFGVSRASSQVSAFSSVSMGVSSWTLTVTTPFSRLGTASGATVNMMFAYTSWNSGAGLPNKHTAGTNVQQSVALPTVPTTTTTTTTAAPTTTTTTPAVTSTVIVPPPSSTTLASPTSTSASPVSSTTAIPVSSTTTTALSTTTTTTAPAQIFAASFSLFGAQLYGVLSFNTTTLLVEMAIVGDYAGTLGVSSFGMSGHAVSCYVPPGNPSHAVCVDLDAISYNIFRSSSQVTQILTVTVNSSASVVLFATPRSRFPSLSSQCRMIFAKTPFDSSNVIPTQHGLSDYSDHDSLQVNFVAGTVRSLSSAGTPVVARNRAYLIVGVTAGSILLIAAVLSYFNETPLSQGQTLLAQVAACALLLGLVAIVAAVSYQDFVDAGVPQPQYRIFGEASAFIFSLLLIPTTKHVGLGRLLGSSYERLIFLHPLLAFILIITMTTHMGGMFGMFENKSDLLKTNRYVFGFITWILVMCMALPAMFLRRNSYWFFRLTHCLFILVLLFAALHYDRLWPMLVPGCALWVLDVILRIRSASAANAIVRSVRHDTNSGVTCLQLSVSWSHSPPPGSYAFLLIPSISLLMHPFSIAMAEGSDPIDHTRRVVTLLIKSIKHSDDNDDECVRVRKQSWTSVLADIGAKSDEVDDNFSAGPKISCFLFGPHGRLQIPLELCSHVVLVAGGIGVTPLLSIMEALASHPTRYAHVEHVTFVWSARGSALFDFLWKTITGIYQRMVVQQQQCAMAIHLFDTSPATLLVNTNPPASNRARGSHQQQHRRVLDPPATSSHAAVTDAMEMASSPPTIAVAAVAGGTAAEAVGPVGGSGQYLHRGRLNVDRMFRTALAITSASSYSSPLSANEKKKKPVGCFVCGPPQLADEVCSQANLLDVWIHRESFDLL